MVRRSNLVLSCLICTFGLVGCVSQDRAAGGQAASDRIECNDKLYMPAHLPEECFAPLPEVAAAPDPIVGTYRIYRRDSIETVMVLRVMPNGFAGWNGNLKNYRWERDGDVYKFFLNRPTFKPGSRPHLALRYQSLSGEPQLVLDGDTAHSFGNFWGEGIKVSENPRHLFDLYRVECRNGTGCFRSRDGPDGKDISFTREKKKPDGSPFIVYYKEMDIRAGWTCQNVGRRINDSRTYWAVWQSKASARDHADTFTDCMKICGTALLNHFDEVGTGNCEDYVPRR